jgi:hypothetical protein
VTGSGSGSGSRSLWRALAALVLGVGAALALGISAVHATRTTDHLSSTAHVRSADFSNAFYDCLDAEAQTLLRPRDVVYLADPQLIQWVTLAKVLGGREQMTFTRTAGTVAVVLQAAKGPGTCQGQVMVTARRLPDGRLVFVNGRSTLG